MNNQQQQQRQQRRSTGWGVGKWRGAPSQKLLEEFCKKFYVSTQLASKLMGYKCKNHFSKFKWGSEAIDQQKAEKFFKDYADWTLTAYQEMREFLKEHNII